MSPEFELIRRHFTRPARTALLGVGDDCALVAPQAGLSLAVTTDMLIEGRHFPAGTDARSLGHKALAVNLSDLAAMGAEPRWVTLAIALPAPDGQWLEAFAQGFFALADRYQVELIGGDTNRGPLAFSVTALGEVPAAYALRRDGARPGDDIWVSGALGAAALGLAHLQGRVQLDAAAAAACVERLNRPEPRVELGGRLRGLATSAIDLSDGFVADLGHVLEASGAGASVAMDSLPRAGELGRCGDAALARSCLLSGGDDYELLFTVPRARRAEVAALAGELNLALAQVGTVTPGEPRLVLRDARGEVFAPEAGGFDHFA